MVQLANVPFCYYGNMSNLISTNVCMSIPGLEGKISSFFIKKIKVGFLPKTSFLLDYPQRLQLRDSLLF